MDGCFRALELKNVVVLTILFVCIIMLSCKINKEFDLNNFSDNNLRRIEFVNTDEVLYVSNDKDKINSFLKCILNSKLDTSGVNYKSFEFIRFYDSKGNSYRIAIMGYHFIAGGEKYIIEEDVKLLFQKLFNAT